MRGITLDLVDGKEMYVCDNCGAKCKPNERNRFGKRHPKMCKERKAFTAQIAKGTRSVDADDGAVAQAIAWRFGGEPR